MRERMNFAAERIGGGDDGKDEGVYAWITANYVGYDQVCGGKEVGDLCGVGFGGCVDPDRV